MALIESKTDRQSYWVGDTYADRPTTLGADNVGSVFVDEAMGVEYLLTGSGDAWTPWRFRGTPFSPDAPAIKGTRSVRILAPDNADAADAAAERYGDATGCKAFRVIPSSPAAASLDSILFAWSTTASDLAALNTAMAAIVTAKGTPDGAAQNNVGIILPAVEGATPTGGTIWTGSLGWVVAEPNALFKTIAVRSNGADHDAGVVLEMIS